MKNNLICIFSFMVAASVFAKPEMLRGYGEVSAKFGMRGEKVESASFQCESHDKAMLLYSKLVADWNGMSAIPSKCENGVFSFANGWCFTANVTDDEVVVSASKDRSALAKIAKDAPESIEYPRYLDYFDLRALKFYARPMDSYMGLGVENHWPFAHKVGIGGLACHGIEVAGTMGAGLYSYLPWDYGIADAERNDGMLTLSPTFAGMMPNWIRDRYPEKNARIQKHVLCQEWIQGVEGMSYDNDGPGFPDASSPLLAFERDTINRYVNSPALGGWQFYCGKPIGDQFGPGMSGILWDSSDEGIESQRAWLTRHYTLGELGLRWKGDKNAFASWNDVPAMQLVDLVGGDWDEERWDIFDLDWQWAKAQDPEEWKGHSGGWVKDELVKLGVYPGPDAKWVDVKMPPSHRCNYVDAGRCWYRTCLPKNEWFGKMKGRELYVRLVGHLWDGQRFYVFVNGNKVGESNYAGSGMIGAKIPADTFRGDGTDELVLEMPTRRSCGRIIGPVTLSPNPVQNFPYSDPKINARYLDNKNFQYDALGERGLKVFRYGRFLDRVRPISLSGGVTPQLLSWGKLFHEQGFAMQSTSTDGFYYPSLSDLARLYGFYFIGEPSADVADEIRFDRNFGTIFYSGMSSTAIFMDIEQYMDFENKTGGMTARRPITRLVGKYLLEEPKIALFEPALGHLVGSDAPYSCTLVRGEMQSVHYDGMVVNEYGLADGIVTPGRFPLMVDSGADVMDEKTVRLIEKYVRDGGTFLAIFNTGRHTELEKNAHAFSRISGFKSEDRDFHATIDFTAEETVFPLWAGKKFRGWGYGAYNTLCKAAKLTKVAEDAEVIANWSDGGIAAGVRNLGKGRIITLGSQFYRDAADIRGKYLPSKYNELQEQFFSQLGAEKTVDATSESVWVRKAVSKDGTEDWYFGLNVATDPKTQQPLSVKSDFIIMSAEKPSAIYDAITGESLDFKYADGKSVLKDVEFGPYKTRIFAIPRDVPGLDQLAVWWKEKKTYWHIGEIREFPDVNAPVDNAVIFDKWQFSTDGTNWRDAKPITWKLQFPDLKNYKGKAFYRTAFKTPEGVKKWQLRYNYRTLYDKADIILNGEMLMTFDQGLVHRELIGDKVIEVTNLLKTDGTENLLEVKIDGGKVFTAGICDYLWMLPETELTDEISLKGEWEAVGADLLTVKPFMLPGKTTTRFLRKKVNIPTDWKGKSIWIRVQTPVSNPLNMIGSVVIDGVGRNLGTLMPFGNREVINVTDLVTPGRENVIELWQRRTVPVDWKGKPWGWALEDVFDVEDVVIGTKVGE